MLHHLTHSGFFCAKFEMLGRQFPDIRICQKNSSKPPPLATAPQISIATFRKVLLRIVAPKNQNKQYFS